jgi:hypothetical protein
LKSGDTGPKNQPIANLSQDQCLIGRSSTMRRITGQICILGFFLATLLDIASPAFPQGAGANPELQQKVAVLKESMAQNQQSLRRYTWTETTDTIFKGETKSSKRSQCQYGPDGKVQKTSLGGTPPPEQKRGLKGRVVEKKKGEMKEYMERVASLVQRYVPPDSSQMQESFQSGKATLQPSGANGIVILIFRDYAKAGDSVSLTFDTAAKKIQSYDVNTFLDAPADVVTLKVVFENLPDGTNHVAQSVLDATAKQIQIRNTNSGYNKL